VFEASALIPIAVLLYIPPAPFPTVNPFTVKSAVNVLAPAIVWAVVKSTPTPNVVGVVQLAKPAASEVSTLPAPGVPPVIFTRPVSNVTLVPVPN
jgi:hypothetical protein